MMSNILAMPTAYMWNLTTRENAKMERLWLGRSLVVQWVSLVSKSSWIGFDRMRRMLCHQWWRPNHTQVPPDARADRERSQALLLEAKPRPNGAGNVASSLPQRCPTRCFLLWRLCIKLGIVPLEGSFSGVWRGSESLDETGKGAADMVAPTRQIPRCLPGWM